MENELEDFIRKNKDRFDVQTPDPTVLQKIKEQVKASKKNKVVAFSSRPYQWLAAASVALVVGFFIFWIQTVTDTPESVDKKDGFSIQKEEVFSALNNMESATQRLAGALAACKLKETDKALVDTLIKVMNTDANSNVRLASLDALSKFYREKYVKEQTLAALPKQNDPVVKTALIEFLAKMNEVSIAGELLKIVSDKEASKEIKDQAYAGLFKLNIL